MVSRIKRVKPENKKEVYERKAFVSYILEISDYTYIYFKLFSINEVKKCFAYIYGAKDQGHL